MILHVKKPGIASRKSPAGWRLKTVRACTRLSNEDRGSILVELAVALPTFFLLMFGFINFMMIMFGMCNLSYAGRVATRYACLHSSTGPAPATAASVDAIVAPFEYQYPSNKVTTSLSYPDGNNVGSTAIVSVTVAYVIVLPFYTYNNLVLTMTSSGIITQ